MRGNRERKKRKESGGSSAAAAAAGILPVTCSSSLAVSGQCIRLCLGASLFSLESGEVKADAREGKSARVLLKSCWNPAAWAPGRDKKTTAYTLSHTHSTVKLSVMGYSRLPANGGKRGPSPVGDATAWEPMRFPEHRHGVAGGGGGAGGVRPILMRLQHQLLEDWDL